MQAAIMRTPPAARVMRSRARHISQAVSTPPSSVNSQSCTPPRRLQRWQRMAPMVCAEPVDRPPPPAPHLPVFCAFWALFWQHLRRWQPAMPEAIGGISAWAYIHRPPHCKQPTASMWTASTHTPSIAHQHCIHLGFAQGGPPIWVRHPSGQLSLPSRPLLNGIVILHLLALTLALAQGRSIDDRLLLVAIPQ